MNLSSRSWGVAFAALASLSSVLVVGCESVNSAEPPTSTDAGATPADAGNPQADATTPAQGDASADASSDAGTDAARDAGEPDCYAQPATSAQILNQCTSRGCTPFDNRARLPLLAADGGLPPLP